MIATVTEYLCIGYLVHRERRLVVKAKVADDI